MNWRNHVAYFVSTLVILVSFGAAILLPLPDETKQLFSLPALVGLFSILVQGWRDQVAHERALEIQSRQSDFTLSIASHMAEVVFDKQVAFVEEYSQSLQEALTILFQGPSVEVGTFQTTLRNIRRKYSPWISSALNEKLLPFEKALLEISVDSRMLPTLPVGPLRTQVVDRMFATFTRVIQVSEQPPEDAPDAVNTILSHLKDVLGVSDFEDLRRASIQAAKDRTR